MRPGIVLRAAGGGLRGAEGPFLNRHDQSCFVSPQQLMRTKMLAEAVAVRTGRKVLTAQPVTCFAQMLCVTKAPLSPFLLHFRITRVDGGNEIHYLMWRGKRKKKDIRDIAEMQLPAVSSVGPATKLGGRRLQTVLEKPQAATFPAQEQQKQSCFSCLCCSVLPS